MVEIKYNQTKDLVEEWELLAFSKVDFISENEANSEAETVEIEKKKNKASFNFVCLILTSFLAAFLSIESMCFVYEHTLEKCYFFILSFLLVTPISSLLSKLGYSKIRDERLRFLISSTMLLLSSIFIGLSKELKDTSLLVGRLLLGAANSQSICDLYYMKYCRVVEVNFIFKNLNFISNLGTLLGFVVSLVICTLSIKYVERSDDLMHLYGLIGVLFAFILLTIVYFKFSSPMLIYADDFFDVKGKRAKLEKDVSKEIKEIDKKLEEYNEFVDFTTMNLVDKAVSDQVRHSIINTSSDLNMAKKLSAVGLIVIVIVTAVSMTTFVFYFINWNYELTTLLLNLIIFTCLCTAVISLSTLGIGQIRVFRD